VFERESRGAHRRAPSRRARRGRCGDGRSAGLTVGAARGRPRGSAGGSRRHGAGADTAARGRAPTRGRAGHYGCRCGRRWGGHGGGGDARVARPSHCPRRRGPERRAGAPATRGPARLCGRGAAVSARGRRDAADGASRSGADLPAPAGRSSALRMSPRAESRATRDPRLPVGAAEVPDGYFPLP
jgi:hypothetical protein